MITLEREFECDRFILDTASSPILKECSRLYIQFIATFYLFIYFEYLLPKMFDCISRHF